MRIYNKKGLIWAVAWILLSGWNLVHSLADPASSGLVQGKDLLLSLFMLAVGITGFVRAFSRQAALEDRIEEEDERNQALRLRAKGRTLDLLNGLLWVLFLAGGAGFVFTRETGLLYLLVVPGVLLGLLALVECLVTLYYEVHG